VSRPLPAQAWSEAVATSLRALKGSPRRIVRGLALTLVVTAGLLVVFCSPLYALLVPQGDALRVWLGAFGPWASLAFVALCAMGVGLGAPRLAFAAAGGLLFGAWAGVLLVQAGTVAGCLLVFTWTRCLGATRARGRASPSHRLVAQLEQHPVAMQVLLRLLPLGNCLAVNLLLGCTSIRARDFALGAFLGTLPATVVCALFGASARSASAGLLLGACSALAALALLGALLLRRTGRRRGGPAEAAEVR
jgi:uncharacterized membrane protein YdjX (TVP38/TMEM64 family)